MKTAAEFSLRDLQQHLLAGEKIEIRRLDQQKSYLQLQGDSAQALDQKALLIRLINWLPVEKRIWRLERKEVLNTAAFPVEFSLTGDQRSALQNLTIVAARISWYVAAMLLALLLAWGLLEVNIMRRITLLSKRAKALSSHVKASQGIDQFNLNDLRSADELGVLASCLQDLLRRVRERSGAGTNPRSTRKDMWHAVGHEIMSPLQSLLALHQREDDPSLRYLQRMQQALTILYGNAFRSISGQCAGYCAAGVAAIRALIEYAPDAGIADLIWTEPRPPRNKTSGLRPMHSLEDVFSHILNNALRYRLPDTPLKSDYRRMNAMQ
jgi:signal transduction histidine kinase